MAGSIRSQIRSPASTVVTRQSKLPTLRKLYAKRTIKSYLDRISIASTYDITRLKVDVIVNSARSDLLGGDEGTVDREIHRAAGPKLLEECKKMGGCAVGDAKISYSYKVSTEYIIHAVGPVYNTAGHEKNLASCYRASLKLASVYKLKTIAFPLISVGGKNGYPLEEAIRIALDTVRRFLTTEQGDKIELVAFVPRNETELIALRRIIPEYFPGGI